jgi:hypothetical protein
MPGKMIHAQEALVLHGVAGDKNDPLGRTSFNLTETCKNHPGIKEGKSFVLSEKIRIKENLQCTTFVLTPLRGPLAHGFACYADILCVSSPFAK